MSGFREVRKIVREVERRGWTVTRGRGHYKMFPPGGGPLVVASVSPSDVRAIRSIRADIRKAERRGAA